MEIKFPWAKRNHIHPDPTFWKYEICSGCGHLIRRGQVRNKRVQVRDRVRGLSWSEIYGESCAPDWDIKEIAIDGQARYYKEGKEINNAN